MITTKTTAPPRLPAIRLSIECGLPAIAVCDGHAWTMLPCTSLHLALRFAGALGYSIPSDACERIRQGQIVTLEAPSKCEHVPNCSRGEAPCEE
jgi:hypothetical protein